MATESLRMKEMSTQMKELAMDVLMPSFTPDNRLLP